MNIDKIATGEELAIDAPDYIEDEKSREEFADEVARLSKERADKILKKNKKEIARLKRHAELCLYQNNKAGYVYAISKLRGIYRQPSSDALCRVLFDTSREKIIELTKQAMTK